MRIVSSGSVLALHRWPVKGFAGEALAAVRLGPRGVGGDRVHFLTRGGARFNARAIPRVLAWGACYPAHPGDALDPADPPEPQIRAPDGSVREWSDPELPAAVSADLGYEIALHRDLGGRPDEPGTVLVTTEASRRAVQERTGRPIDIRRFRPNLHLGLDAPPFAERNWTGHRIAVGEAILEVAEPCDRCVVITRDPDTLEKWGALLVWVNSELGTFFGVRARVLTPGRVARGDQAEAPG